jgi:hypothetical protein
MAPCPTGCKNISSCLFLPFYAPYLNPMTIHQRITSIGVGLAVIIFAGGAAVWQVMARAAASNALPQSTSASVKASTTSSGQTYVLTDVATHKNKSSCWAAVNGGVYDLTPWIAQHPGGEEAILSICGTDGSAAFNAQHSGQADPAKELARFKIGTLSTGEPDGKN